MIVIKIIWIILLFTLMVLDTALLIKQYISMTQDEKRYKERLERERHRYKLELDMIRKAYGTKCDIYILDKRKGDIHILGTDEHDSVWVDEDGTVHYHNLQTGDGCSSNSHLYQYEFLPSDCGELEEPYKKLLGGKEI